MATCPTCKAQPPFLAGVTSKTISSDAVRLVAKTGFGATLNRILTAAGTPGSKVAASESDGASMYDSETAKGIAGDIINVGDIDHEEYYGAPTGGEFTPQGRANARTTFNATFTNPGIDLQASRCTCANLTVDAPRGDSVTSPEKLAVNATLTWPVELDKKPGGRIDRTEVNLHLEGGRSLGSLEWKDSADGVVNLSGSLDVSGLALGTHQLAVRVWFFDKTMLQSENASFTQRSPNPTPSVTTAPSTAPGSGQWVLKQVLPNVGKSELAPGYHYGEVPCNIVTKASATESSATIASSGGCADGGASKQVTQVTQHSWGRPPDRLTPGQDVTLTGSASGSGVCFWNGATGKDCIVTTALAVLQGDRLQSAAGTISWGQVFAPPESEKAHAATNSSATWKWKAPKGSTGSPTLLIQFEAHAEPWGTIKTQFWYEWTVP